MSKVELQAELVSAIMNPKSTTNDVLDIIARGADPNLSGFEHGRGVYEQPMVLAVSRGNIEVLRAILEAGGKFNNTDELDHIAFFQAKSLDHLDLLTEYGASYPGFNGENRSPLSEAYKRYDLARAIGLVQRGASKSELSASDLHWALMEGVPDFVLALQEHPDQVNAPDIFDRTPLLLATRLGNVEAVKILLEAGADVTASDNFRSSTLHEAVLAGSLELVRLLLSSPSGIWAENSENETPIGIANQADQTEMFELLLNYGNRYPHRFTQLDHLLSNTRCSNHAQMLFDAGARLMHEYSVEDWALPSSPEIALEDVSVHEFYEAIHPKLGNDNPEECSHRFWQAMISTREDAFSAQKNFLARSANHESETKEWAHPVWSAFRYRQSFTFLPDGRAIEIGGVHLDYYADFYVYNDVILHAPDELPRIFLYPRNVFPPMEFHTAKLIGNWIYVIGCLGNVEEREGAKCPVFRLDIESLRVEPVITSGDDPGRTREHRAVLLSQNEILVLPDPDQIKGCDSGGRFEPAIFNTETHTWHRYNEP